MSQPSEGDFQEASTRPVHGELVDPFAPSPKRLKKVGGDTPVAAKAAEAKSRRELALKAQEYVKNLLLQNGNQVQALCLTYGISEKEASERQLELHDALVKATSERTLSQLLKDTNTDQASRIILLSQYMYDSNIQASMMATKLIGELDAGTRTNGDSWETWLAVAMGPQAK